MKLAVLGLLVFPVLSWAMQMPMKEVSKCSVGKKVFRVEIIQKGKDGMGPGTLALVKPRLPRIEIDSEVPVSFADTTYPTICDRTAATHLGKDNVIVIYQRDDGTGPMSYHSLIYDVSNHRILEGIYLGYVNNLKLINNRVLFNAKRSVDVTGGHFDYKGKGFSYVSDDINPWYIIHFANGKVATDLDIDLTWKENRWKPYFKDKDDFLKATEYNPKKKTFGRRVVYQANSDNETCIFLGKNPGSTMTGSEKWRCKKN